MHSPTFMEMNIKELKAIIDTAKFGDTGTLQYNGQTVYWTMMKETLKFSWRP